MSSTNLFDLYEIKKFLKVLASTLTIAAFAAVLVSCEKDPDLVGQVDTTFENISGFTIGFSREMSETETIRRKITQQLETIISLIPGTGVAKISKDTIWIFEKTGDNGYVALTNTTSSHAGSIVIGNKNAYLTACLKDSLLLWSYFSGLVYEKYISTGERQQLDAHYNQVKSGKYDKVYYHNGTKLLKGKVSNAPATKSPGSYLGEMMKAYYSQNNYYPFTWEELARFDPEGLSLVKSVFGERDITPNPHGISLPPVDYKQWIYISDNNQVQTGETPVDLWYGKYLLANAPGDAPGIAVVASRFVADSAMVQCKYIIETMIKQLPGYALQWMHDNHYRIGIIGANENVTDLPENRAMPVWWPMDGPTYWDDRGRGYGATIYLPLMSCGEENIVYTPSSPFYTRYRTESIMVHEFAHNIDQGLGENRGYKSGNEFGRALYAAFQNAQDIGLWKDTYSMTNEAEYWAEGVQAWFNTCRMQVPVANGSGKVMLKYRYQLEEYDPMLYTLIKTYMPSENLKGYHFDFEP